MKGQPVNLVFDLSAGWSWEFFPDNIMRLTFVVVMIAMISSVFVALPNGVEAALRGALVLDVLAVVALLSAWPAESFWMVVLWVGFITTAFLAIIWGVMFLAKNAN